MFKHLCTQGLGRPAKAKVLENRVASPDVASNPLSSGTVSRKVHRQKVCIRYVSSCV